MMCSSFNHNGIYVPHKGAVESGALGVENIMPQKRSHLSAGLEFRHFRVKATWPLVLSISLGHNGQMPGQEGHQLKQYFCPMINFFFP